MKNYPQNVQQWSDEAYQSMKDAWDELTRFNPFPSESNKEKLIKIAVTTACNNRDISDDTFIKHAQEYANEAYMIDYVKRDVVVKIDFSLCYLLAYFDAHLSLALISQELADDSLANLRSHYDLSYAGNTQDNVLSINYSKKAK